MCEDLVEGGGFVSGEFEEFIVESGERFEVWKGGVRNKMGS